MPIPEYKNRSAEEILTDRYIADSAWQIRAALSWCDYAERRSAPMALHYAGFHLRTGVEHLWFEVLFASRGGTISFDEYDAALKNTTKLYRLIESKAPDYQKFAEFMQVVASADSREHPPTVIWDMGRLRRIHGECGEYLLHFQGIPEKGYLTDAWIGERMKFLFDSGLWIWSTMTSRGNLVVYRPDGLKKPEVFSVWERFRNGAINTNDALTALKIIQPVVSKRP